MSAPVLWSADGAVARIRFNRPEVLNALDGPTAEGFVAAVEAVLADRAVRVVVLGGEGRAFMAGGDLAAFRAARDRPALIAGIIAPLHRAIARLAGAPVVTIAAAQGPVAGAGMSLFLGADFGLLADDAVLNMAYARIGMPPDCGGSWALPRLVGLRRALEIALLCDPVPAAEALRLGLASRVVPLAELSAEAEALAARLAAGPPLALARTKALLRAAAGCDLEAQLASEARDFLGLAGSQDFAEGLEAFFCRRPPRFTGD